MREILFRGKRVDNGEWVYGLPYIRKAGSKEITHILDVGGWFYNDAGMELNHIEEIDPKTLGQYTGIEDKEGEKIWEGDIVRCTDEEDKISERDSDTGVGVIEWLDRWGFWNISEIENSLVDISRNGYVKSIGNIHDNIGLLKEDLK